MRKLLPIIAIVTVLAAGAYLGYLLGRGKGTPSGPVLTLSFLDERAGGAIVARTPEGRFAVLDPGAGNRFSALEEYLRSEGATSVVVVVPSPTPERIGAVEKLAEAFSVTRVYVPARATRVADKAASAMPQGVPETALAEGDIVHVSRSVGMEVLYPPSGVSNPKQRRRADGVLVARLSLGRTSFLLTSDADTATESHLIRSGRQLRSDVLVIPGGGRGEGPSLELLSLVRPSFCVVNASGSRTGPRRAVLRRIAETKTGAALYRTDRDGTVRMTSDGQTIAVSTERRGNG